MFCGKRRGRLLKLSDLVETLKFTLILVVILAVDATVILYPLINPVPIYVPAVAIPACIAASYFAVSRINRNSTFQFWVAFFHRYSSLRRALFLFAFYGFFFGFLWIMLPEVQSLLPETLQPYTISFAVSALAFIFAGALWLNLSATCRAWTLITSNVESTTTKGHVESAIDKGRVLFYSVTVVLIVGGAVGVIDALRIGDIALLNVIIASLIALFIAEYFLLHLWNVAWKLFGSKLYIPYSQEIFNYAWFAIPQRIRAGGSSTIEAQIVPLQKEAQNTRDRLLEVDVQAAGLKWALPELTQKKQIDHIGDEETLYYAWNCQFPDAGDHTINVHIRISNAASVKRETFFSRRVEVTSGKSAFLLALLPVIYGAFNVSVALKQAGII
jgi:hypothetical protein